MIYHPKLDNNGHPVPLNRPSQPTSMVAWSDPLACATVIPEGELPPAINGISFSEWSNAPRSSAGWERLAAQAEVDEPPFLPPTYKNKAAGVVIEELDGRVWLVAPSNRFGGYSATFPKGTVDYGASLQATAIKEALEEAGLQVELTGFFADADRSSSYTRYYRAKRLGGSPAAMGWESQAVHLVPRDQLDKYLTNQNDWPLLEALLSNTDSLTPSEIMKAATLTSASRLLSTIQGYRSRYGQWPVRILMHSDMADAIERHTLTDKGWTMLNNKLDIIRIPEGTVIAEGKSGDRFEYGESYAPVPGGISADIWIWGRSLWKP